MNLILIRHGETEEEKKGIVLGNLPGTPTVVALEKAVEVARNISKADLDPEIIISSDLRRAYDFANVIGKELGIKVESLPLVCERAGGIAEGKTEDEIDWTEYEKIPKPLRKHEGGESFEDVRLRGKEFLKYLQSLSYQTVIVISHSVFLASILMEAKGWELDEALRYNFREPLTIEV